LRLQSPLITQIEQIPAGHTRSREGARLSLSSDEREVPEGD
jgi:hypothetical protein